MNRGYIHPDGRVQLLGCVPEKTTLVGITPSIIAIKHPGGTYYNNGGANYCPAWIDVLQLETLEKAEIGKVYFDCVRRGPVLSFHPTPSKAMAKALRDLGRIMSHKG